MKRSEAIALCDIIIDEFMKTVKSESVSCSICDGNNEMIDEIPALANLFNNIRDSVLDYQAREYLLVIKDVFEHAKLGELMQEYPEIKWEDEE